MRSSIWRTNRSLPSSTEFYYYYLISFISIHFNTFFFLLWIKFLLMRSAIWCTKRSLPSFTEFIFSYFRSAFRFLDVRRRWNSSTKETDGTKEPAFRKRIGAWTPFLSFPFFFFGFSLFCFLYFPLERTDFLGRSYFLVSFGLAPFAVLFRALRIVFGDDLMIFSSADSIKRPKNSVKLGQTRYQRETIQENQTKLWKTR